MLQHAAFWTPPPGDSGHRYDAFAPIFAKCDVVLVEGDTFIEAPKIEVWREEVGSAPLAADDENILAVVTDDDPRIGRPTLKRSDMPQIVSWILKTLDVQCH